MVLVAGFFLLTPKTSAFPAVSEAGDFKIYKSSSCGCCGVFASYATKYTKGVEVINQESIQAVKQQYHIPQHLQSCHTSVVGGYVVEGHIPMEAINKLLEEKPDIKGIAMPGMPAGSPGMPGAKSGPFIIYALHHDGTASEFMRT